MNRTFADGFEGSVKYGAHDPYAGQRGLVRIDWDSTRYYYRRAAIMQLGGLRKFKRWFADNCPTDRQLTVSGSNGYYTVD